MVIRETLSFNAVFLMLAPSSIMAFASDIILGVTFKGRPPVLPARLAASMPSR